MSKQPTPLRLPNRKRTRMAVHGAISEVEHAARPRLRSLKEGLSWAVALAAGATVAYRSFQAARQTGSDAAASAEADLEAERLRHAFGEATATRMASKANSASTKPSGTKGNGKDADVSSGTRSTSAKVDGGFASLAKELYARFNTDQGPVQAAALSFYAMLSLVPILLFALAALGFVIKSPEQAANYVHDVVTHLLPGEAASKAADQFIQQTNIVGSAQGLMRGKWWAILIGLPPLLWSAISLFVTAAGAMNAAWETQEKRGFIKLRLVALGVFLGAGLLFALSLLPTSGPDFIQRLHIPWLGLPKHPPFLIATLMQIGFELLAWAIDIAMFVLIYRFLPDAPVSWKSAATGGAVAGLLWEIFKKAFTVYLAHFGNFNKLYGALGGVFLLVTWIYYSCMVLLVGAIVCKMYHEHKEEGGVARKAT